MEQTPLPKEWPQHIRKDMETFLRLYPDATPDMIKRHAHAMDELTPDAEKSALTPLPPLVSDEELRGGGMMPWSAREVRDFYELDRAKTREVVQALVELRNYFGENDKTPHQHYLFSVADQALSSLRG